MESIARAAGIGPRKMARARARGKVGVGVQERNKHVLQFRNCTLDRFLSISRLWISHPQRVPMKSLVYVYTPDLFRLRTPSTSAL